jgi:hypothetical protein
LHILADAAFSRAQNARPDDRNLQILADAAFHHAQNARPDDRGLPVNRIFAFVGHRQGQRQNPRAREVLMNRLNPFHRIRVLTQLLRMAAPPQDPQHEQM